MAWECPSEENEGTEASLFQICIPAHLSYIGVVRRAMDALGEQLDLSADDRSALKLAVGEACNNAVQYGNFDDGFGNGDGEPAKQQNIGIACRLLAEAIEIEIVSEGSGFQPAPGDYTMPSAESMAENGRGLALIELMMDSVEYLTIDGKHVVRLRKMRTPRDTPND
jgi:serine/threonine-protein kinase RsbW